MNPKRDKVYHQVYSHYMQVGCYDCGVKDIRILNFDHVDNKDKVSVANLVSRGRSFDRVKREFEKGNIVCFNCHSLREESRKEYSRRMDFWQRNQKPWEY